MLRLVYAPKAYVFVRSNNLDGKVFNLSEDCVSGDVERNQGAESKANFVVRNRFSKYLVDQTTGYQIFNPMDMVTIWLQRISGKPIQVFTGYLDSVTVFQMYPDNIQFTASCTLKKLSYQWFNPGLEFFTNWINHMKGWRVDPTTGTAVNYSQAFATAAQDPKKITDGGFAQLIAEFMTHIAGWSPNQVVISDLPHDIPQIAANLYNLINGQELSAQSGLEQVMRNIMGISWAPDSSGLMPDGTLPTLEEKVTRAIQKSCGQYNVPMIVAIIAARLTSGYQPNYSQNLSTATATDAEGNLIWGYGLYQMKPATSTAGATVGHSTTTETGTTIEGYKKQSLLSPVTATDAFCKALLKVNSATGTGVSINSGGVTQSGDLLSRTRSGNVKAIQELISKTLNMTFDPTDFSNAVTFGNTILKTFGVEHKGSTSGQPTAGILGTVQHLTWSDSTVSALLVGTDKKVYAKASPKPDPVLAAYFWIAQQQGGHLHLAPGTGGNKLVLVADQGHESELDSFFKAVGPNGGGFYTTMVYNGSTVQQVYQDGKKGSNSGISSRNQSVSLTVPSNAPYPLWDGQPSVSTGGQGGNKSDPTNQDPSVSFEDLSKMSLTAAFTAQFAFPVNYIEAHFLTGYKELADVTSCMDGLSQFCQASMRQFMSLPSGELCCFYPDYFGAHGRTPYWNIYDIEITSGGVVLSDQTLATHVYTIGDTFGLDGEVDQWDYIASRGVVTLDMPMLLQSFIQPLNGTADNVTQEDHNAPLGKLKTAADFYNHYGARPYKEEVPMIRNSFFEFLYAWQRFMQLWASTFNTTFEFTFQPEVMCGGIIGFPQHNLQMYVEQVTHTWDYTDGFTTTATLSSPAALQGGQKKSAQDVGSLPGMLMAGNINTVGLPSS